MKISSSADYALRMCCYLARKGGMASSAEVSAATNAPRDYLVQIAQGLRAAGILEAKQGRGGGYLLSGAPGDVTVLDVMSAVGEAGGDGGAGLEAACVARKAAQALGGMTLAEVLGDEGGRNGGR